MRGGGGGGGGAGGGGRGAGASASYQPARLGADGLVPRRAVEVRQVREPSPHLRPHLATKFHPPPREKGRPFTPGYASKSHHQGTAGFRPCFHLPGFWSGHTHLTDPPPPNPLLPKRNKEKRGTGHLRVGHLQKPNGFWAFGPFDSLGPDHLPRLASKIPGNTSMAPEPSSGAMVMKGDATLRPKISGIASCARKIGDRRSAGARASAESYLFSEVHVLNARELGQTMFFWSQPHNSRSQTCSPSIPCAKKKTSRQL